MVKLCINCDTELRKPNQQYINNYPKLVTWMKMVGYKTFKPTGSDFYLVHKKKFYKKKWDLNGVINIGKQYKNCYIYYWASHPNSDRSNI